MINGDSESERSRKILQRENDLHQGRLVGPNFWSRYMENATSLNFGGPAGGWAPGRRPAPKSDSTWLVETENSEAPSNSNTL